MTLLYGFVTGGVKAGTKGTVLDYYFFWAMLIGRICVPPPAPVHKTNLFNTFFFWALNGETNVNLNVQSGIRYERRGEERKYVITNT